MKAAFVCLMGSRKDIGGLNASCRRCWPGCATRAWRHWSGTHRDALVKEVGLPLLCLPPYSPELDPAERLFEEVRRQVEGRVYATLDAKAAAVDAYLEQLDANPARVRLRCGWDWIQTACDTLSADAPKAA